MSEEAFGVRTPSYAVIKTLDAQVRAIPDPVSQVCENSNDDDDFENSPVPRMRRWCATQLKESSEVVVN